MQSGGKTKEQSLEPKTEAAHRILYIFQQMPACTNEKGQDTTRPHSDVVALW